MVKVKIHSNPYQKEILFYKWSYSVNDWDRITYATNPNSQLISDKITHSFLTFKAEEIVTILLDEYDDGSEFIIEFEGTNNEYKELEYLIKNINHSRTHKLTLIQSHCRLENAEEVLPTVISIFNRMISLIPESISNDEDIKKFKEASDDIIPLVVLGNYSAGKSTFINSLIGYDILPNSDSPVTAKIIKISKSRTSTTTISFEIDGKMVTITISGKGYQIQTELEDGNNILDDIMTKLSRLESASSEEFINLVLTEINQLDYSEEGYKVSDVITVVTPFNKGILSETHHQFVLFDTPGSNSSSNKNHFDILKTAMRNMSNGLVLFVTEYTSLDTIDNETLFEELRSIEEIDSRFTMIIVNKADGSDFSDFDSGQLLNQSVPKNLFSEGIFFVSSIMGLGSKTEGQFIDRNYDRVFKRSLDEFSNSDSEYYQQLYQYNIVPTQLKERGLHQARQQGSLVYVNSGLYSIEKEIQKFSEHYAAYNKCQQSKLYLEKIIEKTNNAITDMKLVVSQEVEALYHDLEQKKSNLIHEIERQNKRQLDNYYQHFSSKLVVNKGKLERCESLNQLQQICENFYEMAKVDFQLEKYKKESKESQKAVRDHWDRNIANLKRTRDISFVKKIAQEVGKDLKIRWYDNNEYTMQKNKAFDSVSDKVIDNIVQRFEKALQLNKNKLYEFSVMYWQDCSDMLKRKLSYEIGSSDILSIEKQKDIQQLILDYRLLTLKAKQEQYFERSELAEGFKIGTFNLFGNEKKLDLNKVVKKYNQLMSKQIDQVAEELQKQHQNDFEQWATALLHLIKENIVDFNPDLKKANQSIIEKEDEIKNYEAKLAQLVASTNEIQQLLSFKKSQ